jgi:hypothetical protein
MGTGFDAFRFDMMTQFQVDYDFEMIGSVRWGVLDMQVHLLWLSYWYSTFLHAAVSRQGTPVAHVI